MPISGRPSATDRHRLVRMVRCVRGQMTFEVEIAPRFDYGRRAARDARRPRTASCSPATDVDDGARRARAGRRAAGRGPASTSGDVRGDARRCGPGRCAGVVLETAPAGPPRRDPRRPRSSGCSTTPCAFWKSWLAQSTYTGRWREMAEPLGDHPEADDLRPDRRAGRRADRGAARAGRRRAQLGLPLHLGPGRLVLGLRAARAWASSRRRRRSAGGCATGSPSGPAASGARSTSCTASTGPPT